MKKNKQLSTFGEQKRMTIKIARKKSDAVPSQ